MADGTPNQAHSRPKWQGNPVFGYHLPIVQQGYVAREATSVAKFFLTYLQSGMTLLDCGCGPGAITLGLAEAVAPGRVEGIDLEPTMIERAIAISQERHAERVHYQVADIRELPFPDGSFDAVYSSAVLEHLPDPVQAFQEIHRVLKPEGLIGVSSSDWSQPLVSPAEEAFDQFFTLFERGFAHHGGSMCRGRHLKVMLVEAVFNVTEFAATYGNSSTPDAVRNAVEGYVGWIENWALFDQAVELGWVDRPALDQMVASMRQWSDLPHAFLATARCVAVGRKS